MVRMRRTYETKAITHFVERDALFLMKRGQIHVSTRETTRCNLPGYTTYILCHYETAKRVKDVTYPSVVKAKLRWRR